jgi:hypothetical protein
LHPEGTVVFLRTTGEDEHAYYMAKLIDTPDFKSSRNAGTRDPACAWRPTRAVATR